MPGQLNGVSTHLPITTIYQNASFGVCLNGVRRSAQRPYKCRVERHFFAELVAPINAAPASVGELLQNMMCHVTNETKEAKEQINLVCIRKHSQTRTHA